MIQFDENIFQQGWNHRLEYILGHEISLLNIFICDIFQSKIVAQEDVI